MSASTNLKLICFSKLVLFRVFDHDHDGVLNRSDIIYMTSCLIEVAQFVYVPNIHINTSPEVYTDQILSNNDGILKPEDFLTWCQKDGLIIELLNLVFQTCHVVLGLRPSLQQDEVTIVKYVIKNRIIIESFFSLLFKTFSST